MVIKERSSLKGTSRVAAMKEAFVKKEEAIVLDKLSFYDEGTIGVNAGQLWTLLNSKGIQSVKLAIAQLKVSEQEMHLAIGWLAREGKILFEKNNDEIYLFLK